MGSGVDRTLLVSGDLCLGRGLLLCDEDTRTQDPHSDDRHTCLHDGDTGTQKVPYRMGDIDAVMQPMPGPFNMCFAVCHPCSFLKPMK